MFKNSRGQFIESGMTVDHIKASSTRAEPKFVFASPYGKVVELMVSSNVGTGRLDMISLPPEYES